MTDAPRDELAQGRARRLDATDPRALDIIEASLRAGECIALPTETVYGLAADATNGEAVAGIFAAKGRPSFNPLICHVADLAMAHRLAVLPPLAVTLADAFWPGPVTIVVPMRAGSGIHPLTTAGLETVGLRHPQGVVAELCRRLDRPLAAPSANPSGRVSATTAAHVMAGLGHAIPYVLDAGRAPVGVESTIVEAESERLVLLRPGGVSRSDIERACGVAVVSREQDAAITAPGQLKSHYAPAGRVRPDARHVEPGEALIAFGPEPIAGQENASRIVNLSPAGDLTEAAANLFSALASLDHADIARIAVAPIPKDGLGEAINDRLRRAAAPRE